MHGMRPACPLHAHCLRTACALHAHVHITCMPARVQGTSLYVGSVPRTAAHLAELHSLGVRAVVTLNQAWEPQVDGGVPKAAAAAGMHHLNAPTPDFAAPTQRHLRAAVEFMEEHVNAGHGVYVHCNGGRGRSVVCLLGFLVRSKGLTAHEAYALVAQHRRARVGLGLGSGLTIGIGFGLGLGVRVGLGLALGLGFGFGLGLSSCPQGRRPTRQTGHLGPQPLPRVRELAASSTPPIPLPLPQ